MLGNTRCMQRTLGTTSCSQGLLGGNTGVESAVYDCLVFYRGKAMLQSVRVLSVQLSHIHCCKFMHFRPVISIRYTHTHTRAHALAFNGPLSGTTWVCRNQKGKPVWILLKQETVSGSGISWAVCKSAPRCRQTTIPAPHRSVFYRPDALPAAQPTVSEH